jgi:hypothetical protein
MWFMPLGLLGAFFLAGLSGCIFSPDQGGGGKKDNTTLYRMRSSPQNVLFNLIHAYEDTDTAAYMQQFAPNYQGQTYDTDTLSGLTPGAITRDDEQAHIKAIAEDHDIIGIELGFPPEGAWLRHDAADDSGRAGKWTGITIQRPTLRIDFVKNTVNLVANESFEYAFKPITPAPTSPTDTLWTIGRWEEIAP